MIITRLSGCSSSDEYRWLRDAIGLTVNEGEEKLGRNREFKTRLQLSQPSAREIPAS